MTSKPAGRQILIGMNDRLFLTNKRPILQDIAFAAANDLRAIQFHGSPDGLGEAQLGASLNETGAALREYGVAAVIEILIFIDEHGQHESGQTPLDILQANMPAITALGCIHAHWHLAIRQKLDESAVDRLEVALAAQAAQAVLLAEERGFRFAIEHNEQAVRPFNTPERMASILGAVPGLGMVWDLNHAAPEQVEGYLALTPRISMLHVGDTPLPDVNHHLPLGMGNIDFRRYLGELVRRGFSGPAIFEIGGLPRSGGYGRDSDEALISSRDILRAAIEASQWQ